MTALELSIRQLVAEELARANGEGPTRRNALMEAMTADEVAEFLGLDRKTVYDYANRKRIPHRRLGKRLLFSRSAVVSWLAGRDRGAR
jgi:excisionase family DNA binding protein